MPRTHHKSAPTTIPELHTDVFDCFVDYDGPTTAEVHISGELDIATAPQLAETLRAALANATLVVLDLSQLTFMDCTGLAAIIRADSRARRSRRRLVLVRGAAQVNRLLDVTKTSERFEIMDCALSEARHGSASPSAA
jgi:anti-anti-sigma factor